MPNRSTRAVVFRASRYGKETMSGATVGRQGRAEATARRRRRRVERPRKNADSKAGLHQLPVHARRVPGVPRCARDGRPASRRTSSMQVPYFEGCLPVEVMARARAMTCCGSGRSSPSGSSTPGRDGRPYAVVAAPARGSCGPHVEPRRLSDAVADPGDSSAYSGMIPGLAEAEFLRYGSIHRNSYVNSPAVLTPAPLACATTRWRCSPGR